MRHIYGKVCAKEQTFGGYHIPPVTKGVVKQRLGLVLLSAWDAYYMYNRYMLGEG